MRPPGVGPVPSTTGGLVAIEGDHVNPLPGVYSALKGRVWLSAEGGKILGDAETEEAHLHGPTSVRGRLSTGLLDSSRSLDVRGTFTARGVVALTGETTVAGAMTVGSLVLHGTLVVGAALTVRGSVRGKGRLTVVGDLEAADFKLVGSVDAGGTVRCDRFELTVTQDGQAAAVEAQRVLILPGGPMFGRKPVFEVLRLEAHEAGIDATRCEYLRADRFALGPRVQVSRYDGELVRRHRSSRLGPVSVSAPPIGLSR